MVREKPYTSAHSPSRDENLEGFSFIVAHAHTTNGGMLDWTKIKTKHFLLSDMTLLEQGALARLLCLTAHLERMPTPRELSRQVPERCLTTLRGVLERSSTTLPEVLERVLEDVSAVHHKRATSRETSRKYRTSVNSDTSRDIVSDATEKRREDNIREDKSILFEKLWGDYPRKLGKGQAVKHFTASVKTANDLADIQTALKNYLAQIEAQNTKEQYIKHGSTWFNNWQDYVNLTPPKTEYSDVR